MPKPYDPRAQSMYDFAKHDTDLALATLNDHMEWFFKCWGSHIPEDQRYRFEADIGMLIHACHRSSNAQMLGSISQVVELVLSANPLLKNRIIATDPK